MIQLLEILVTTFYVKIDMETKVIFLINESPKLPYDVVKQINTFNCCVDDLQQIDNEMFLFMIKEMEQKEDGIIFKNSNLN